MLYWHERRRCSRLPLGDAWPLFLSRSVFIEGVFGSKAYLAKVDSEGPQVLRFVLFPDPIGHFGQSGGGGVAGGVALQLLNEY